jgi:cellulose synthase/poly-beta-1,6-N-acetylglucosamine synthase-like glycosyltransferase
MSTSIAALIGLVYGAVLTGMAFVIAGGGHGWCSTLISAVGLGLLPLGAVAWTRRHRTTAVIAITLGLVSDIALVVATAREGVEYVQRIFETIPLFVLSWLALWLVWQIAVIVALVRGTFASRPSI